VRSTARFNQAHVPGAVSLPHGKIIGSRMSAYPLSTLFVTYCAGPHCNGAARKCRENHGGWHDGVDR
jgi:rhodanese-related sulfurtransferase